MADPNKIANDALKILGGSDDMERLMYRQDLDADKRLGPVTIHLDNGDYVVGVDYGSRPDRGILTQFSAKNELMVGTSAGAMTATEVMRRYGEMDTTLSTAKDAAEAFSFSMINEALEILARNNIPMVGLDDYLWHDVYAEDERTDERPAFATQFSSMDKYPQYIEGPAGMTATLLSDDQEVFDESATMRHCLWRFYTSKIERGQFIAYHIDTPALFKHGFTCCFARGYVLAGHFNDYKIRTRDSDNGWIIDQIRGKANSVSADPDLLAFAESILQEINGV